jgi:hypothetical protein
VLVRRPSFVNSLSRFALVLTVLLTSSAAMAQSLPPLPTFKTDASGNRLQSATLPPNKWILFPTVGEKKEDVADFFGITAIGITPLDQVKFLLKNDQKTLWAEWFAGVLGPVRVGASSAVSDTSSSSTSSGAGNTQKPDTTAADDAMNRVINGGDIMISGALPILAYSQDPKGTGSDAIFRAFVFFLPRIGLNIPALGTNTVTQVTEWNFEPFAGELYAEYGNSDLKVYAHTRLAYDYVSQKFADAVQITQGNHFGLGELSAGLQFAFLRVSVLKLFAGPDGNFSQAKDAKLLVQIVPFNKTK